MNIRVIEEKENTATRKSLRPIIRRGRQGDHNYVIALLTLVILLILFTGGYMQVKFSNEIEKLNRVSSLLNQNLHDMGRELENVRIEEQKYTGKYILSKVRTLKLKLTFPKPGQVRKLYVDRTHIKKKSEFDGDFILSLN